MLTYHLLFASLLDVLLMVMRPYPLQLQHTNPSMSMPSPLHTGHWTRSPTSDMCPFICHITRIGWKEKKMVVINLWPHYYLMWYLFKIAPRYSYKYDWRWCQALLCLANGAVALKTTRQEKNASLRYRDKQRNSQNHGFVIAGSWIVGVTTIIVSGNISASKNQWSEYCWNPKDNG